MADLKITPTTIDKVTIPDRKGNPTEVHKGDLVDLADSSLITGEGEKREANQNANFLRGWLGEGPYIVENIGQWPCGEVTFYLKTKTSSRGEAYASQLVYCGRDSCAADAGAK